MISSFLFSEDFHFLSRVNLLYWLLFKLLNSYPLSVMSVPVFTLLSLQHILDLPLFSTFCHQAAFSNLYFLKGFMITRRRMSIGSTKCVCVSVCECVCVCVCVCGCVCVRIIFCGGDDNNKNILTLQLKDIQIKINKCTSCRQIFNP